VLDPGRADRRVRPVREVLVELRTPLAAMDEVAREVLREVVPFMRRGDALALRSISLGRDSNVAVVEVVRPEDGEG
jgi:hypothetical protein